MASDLTRVPLHRLAHGRAGDKGHSANISVIAYRPGYVEAMAKRLADYRGTTLIDGAGHWTQQEAPEAFNQALLGALAELERTGAAASG